MRRAFFYELLSLLTLILPRGSHLFKRFIPDFMITSVISLLQFKLFILALSFFLEYAFRIRCG